MSLRVTKQNGVSVYTISGSSTTRSLPDWIEKKNKRKLKNDEAYQNRIELVQDFEFEEASQCIQVSEDGEYAMATGTYKPQMHIYHLPSSALKYARHTSALNLTFLLLSTDYSKSLHLQTDRSLEFHTPMGCHYATRIPRYGRSLAYLKPHAHAIITAEGNDVFRLDLEAGRFLKPFEVGGFDDPSGVKSVECVGVAERSHGLLAFGTSAGTTEFWDPRSRNRVGILSSPSNAGLVTDMLGEICAPSITSAQFHSNGFTFGTGNQAGIVTLYDLRSPTPLLRKDQGYGFPVHTLKFLSTHAREEKKVLVADKKVIKIFDQETGKHWTSILPNVDLNHVCTIPNSGMIFTANEGQQMHSFLIPALGPSPSWCSHLDSQIEQLADVRTVDDPDAYTSNVTESAVFENKKFLGKKEFRQLGLDELLSTGRAGSLVRPYMQGYFVDIKLYEELRLNANPEEWIDYRNKIVRQKIEKERESRIRTLAKDKVSTKVKQNKRLAKRLQYLEEKLDRKKKKEAEGGEEGGEGADRGSVKNTIVNDPRFRALFENPDFAIDENSAEFKLHNPSTIANRSDGSTVERKRGKTAVEEEEDSEARGSSSEEDSSEDEVQQETYEKKKREPEMRMSTSSYRKSGHNTRGYPTVTQNQKKQTRKEKVFGSRLGESNGRPERTGPSNVLGEKEVTFHVGRKPRGDRPNARGERAPGGGDTGRTKVRNFKDRRSASGNAFRKAGIR